MKATERHKLKENEFARSVAHARQVVGQRRGDLIKLIAALIVLLVIVAGYAWWRSAREARANQALASALAVYEMPVVPIPPPAPGSPPPVPQPGTFSTEQEKLTAALPKFVEAADAHPNTKAGIVARFHAAAILAAQGKAAEAEQRYKEVIEKAGKNDIYARTGKLGLAEAQIAQGKYDSAIALYTELSRDAGSTLPLDSVLMHLGRAYARAGKKEEAVRSFTRVVDEFPQSAYAADARREMEESKKAS